MRSLRLDFVFQLFITCDTLVILNILQKEPTMDHEFAQEEDDVHGIEIVSLFQSGRRIGISHYSELQSSVSTDGIVLGLEEIEGFIIDLKTVVKPTLFILHPRIAANLSLLKLLTSSLDGTPETYQYKIVKSSSWNAEMAIELMCSRFVVKDMLSNDFTVSQSERERYIALSAKIDIENTESLSALGALLTYLQSDVMNLENGMIYVSKLSNLNLNSYMRLTAGTLKGLQIFQEDYHPNVIRGPGRSKEGFSLFALFDRTLSIPGRECLRVWMSRPLYDKDKIIRRQEGIEAMMRPENAEFILHVSKLLRKICSIPRIILRIKKVMASVREWCKLINAISAAGQIYNEIGLMCHRAIPISDKRFVSSLFVPAHVHAAKEILNVLSEAIDVELSMKSDEIYISRGYNRELDELTDIYDNLEEYLTQGAREILENVPLLNHVAVEYVPQIGYLAVIDLNDTQFLDVTDFTLVYEMEGKGFYKCGVVLAMDDSIGDIKGMISDMKKNILLMLEELVLDAESDLFEVSVSLGVLDASMSLAGVATELNFVKPEISDEPVIIIKNGRHPLQELTVDVFVPNDTYLTGERNIALITGENGSGKSVYIKQVGVMVYLAHIGSWLPCEKAIIGLTDRILTRISSVETAFSPHSSFSMDLCQISRILREHTEKSLCLIDEFGKGTAPIDGIALLASLIRSLSKGRTKCLFVLHFTEIFNSNIVDIDRMGNVAAFKMVVHREEEDSIKDHGDAPSIIDGNYSTPLYKLCIGVSDSSGGIACARVAGVKASVLKRAEVIKNAVLCGNKIPCYARDTRISKPQNLQILKAFLDTGKDVKCWKDASDADVEDFRMLIKKS